MRTKIAIACQGGGSQTAFTAGVIKGLVEAKRSDEFEVVGISGTSGGALCATIMWYSLHKGEQPSWQRMMDFWADNQAQTPSEIFLNDSMIQWLRWVNRGMLPIFQTSPAATMVQQYFHILMQGQREEFSNFTALLRKHVDFDEIASWGPQHAGPTLILGAASVLSGQLRKFNSSKEVIRLEHVLASAAVPNLFTAVEIDGDAYWDGLFSDNPPIDDLVRKGHVGEGNVPQELWVIKINPTTSHNIPKLPDEILDRRNELEGNVSLFQNLKWLEMINDMIIGDAFRPEFLEQFEIPSPIRIPKCFADLPDKPYHIPLIEMSPEVQRTLDYEGKLDRNPKAIGELIAHGEEQAARFLVERSRVLAAR